LTPFTWRRTFPFVYTKRIIGIDYGRKRIGIAYSDPLRITAQPLTTLVLKSPAEAVKKVCAALVEHDVELVVVGLPVSISGASGGQMADEIRQFARGLQQHGYHVHLEDEAFTSQTAKGLMRQGGKSEKQMRGKIDALAAQIILQDYLNSHFSR
jgi:putative Holliday junction resolvase